MARVLIVEDEGVLRLTFRQFLRNEGYETETAEDYEAAMARLDGPPYDVVVLDILLGDGNGIDLLRAMGARGLDARVVMITGEPDADSAAAAVRLGAFDYLAKPVTGPDLLRVVRLAIEHKRLEEERNAYAERADRYRRDLEAVFNSVSEGIVTVDTDLRIHQANQAFRDILGAAGDALDGRLLGDLLPGALAPARSAVDRAFATGRPATQVRVETWVPGQGDKVLVLGAAPLVGDAEQGAGVVLVFRDVTRITMLEREAAGHRAFRNMVANSRAMRDVTALIENVAPTDATVLVCGESGTGKELVAEALHHGSLRKDGPLIKVNCAALAEDILESELFGHVKGAFTSAVSDRVGRFEAADGGTILLDEIGDIPPRLQLRLLRVLQAREFERVGDSFPMRTDVRVIASTNRDLPAKIRAGAFREDLYFRLNVVRIELPPLRERHDDIPLIVAQACRRFNALLKKEVDGVAPETMDLFMRYAWPGNVRELENCLERAFIVCQDTVILPRHLPREVAGAGTPATVPGFVPEAPPHAPRARDLEAAQLRAALERTDWNVAKTARILGVARNTVYHKMRRFNLVRAPR